MSDAPHPLGPLAPLAQWPRFVVARRSDKVPIDPNTGANADAQQPSAWLPYEAAAAHVARLGAGYGLGWVVVPPVFCVDLDNALQPDNTWSPLALAICNALPGTVVEVSQSGRGLHAWGLYPNPPEHAKKNTALGAECYTERRYILLGSGAVGTMAERCDAFPAVLAQYFPPPPAAVAVPDEGPCAEWRGPTDDTELIRRALASRSAATAFGGGVSFADLWAGDPDALARRWPAPNDRADGLRYDASSADAALAAHLAWWTGKDRARIERLMRQSGLSRDKHERPDYLSRTIDAACSRCRDVLRDREPTPVAADPVGPSAAAPIASGEAPRYSVIPDDPLNGARAYLQRHHEHPDGPRFVCWRGAFHEWDGAAWREHPEADVRADLWRFLDGLGASYYRPTHAKVSALLEALRAAAHMASAIDSPSWLPGTSQGMPASVELMPCANGLLHLPTRTVQPPTPRYFNLHAAPYAYLPGGPAPAAWLQFLAQLWPSDPESVNALQEVFGYLLTPDTRQQKLFLLIGPPRSGKGTIARVLTALLGAPSVASPTLSSMATPFGLAPLVGKLVALIADARLSGKADAKDVAENLLRVSGEDAVEVNRKYRDSVTMRLGVRFLLLTNELPRIADASGAMASRFLTLKITQTFYGREDQGLTARLLAELPGILNWSIEGWQRLNARGHFIEPKSSALASQELADLASPVSAFVRDTCNRGPRLEVPVDSLYAQWRTWCAQQGIERPGTKQQFGRDLGAAFPEIEVTQPRIDGARVRSYRGLALATGTGGTHWHAMPPFVEQMQPPAISTVGDYLSTISSTHKQ